MSRANHRRAKVCKHCGETHIYFSMGFRWVEPLTYVIHKREFRLRPSGRTRAGRTIYTDHWVHEVAIPMGWIRSQLAEIACAKRMGRPVEHY